MGLWIFDGFDQRLLADSLFSRVQGENGLFHSVWVVPTGHPSFQLAGASATFQQVLWLHTTQAATYLYNVIIHSDSWAEHMQREVCGQMKGGTVYGVPTGRQAGAPQIDKTAAIEWTDSYIVLFYTEHSKHFAQLALFTHSHEHFSQWSFYVRASILHSHTVIF